MRKASTQKSLSNRVFCKFFCLLFFVSCFQLSEAQLAYNVNYNASQLVQNLLGTGISYSNATLRCGDSAAAIFTYVPDASLAFTNGVLLVTGGVRAKQCQNLFCTSYIWDNSVSVAASNQMSLAASPNYNDPQLNALANSTDRNDACVVEFDFLPLGDSIKFNYSFASEEYPEYVCSQFNDVFGFFVTGPNPSGGTYTNQNIALIPGTNLPVTINNVNPGTVGANGTSSNCSGTRGSLSYSQYYHNNSSSANIVFDGITKNLTAKLAVVPCSTYHMKLGVEDVGDNAYDSGVFLQGGSLSSNATSISTALAGRLGANNNNLGNNIGEGCDTGFVKIKTTARPTSYTIHYTIGGTATNGTDYQTIV